MKNKFMTVCQTYPPILIQPLTVSDEVMKSMSKLFKRNRIPAIIWKSSNSAILARSEAFNHVPDLLRNRHRRHDHERDPVKDFELWLLCVVKITPQKTGTVQSVLQHSNEIYQSTMSIHSESTKPFVRGMANTLQQSVSTKWTSLQRLKRNSTAEVSSPVIDPTRSRQADLNPRLVVFVNKKNAQRARVDPDSEVELVACDLTLDGLRDAHKSLIKSLANERTRPTIGSIGESGWYALVSSCLAHASAISALIELEKVSVLVSLESGWDLTSVLVSLSQTLMDETYRTFDGLQTLIEREFLSFGHRFSHNGLSEQNQSPLPVFLLFLDCLAQIVAQNSSCFQFTPFYLEVIAYHLYSGRFSTFLLDSDYDRIESGIMFDNKSCLWNYLNEATQISHVTQEPICPRLVNMTYSPASVLITVSEHPCHFQMFNLFCVQQISNPNQYDNIHSELNVTQEENSKKTKRNLVYGIYAKYADLAESQRNGLPSGELDSELIQPYHDLLLTQTRMLITRARASKGDPDASSAIREQDEKIRTLPPSNRSHEGYLFKQSNSVFHSFKLSYFVLEGKQQLVQYDESQTGQRVRTKSIDLKDLLECKLNDKSVENLPKGTEPHSVIQIRLRSRKYVFVAREPSAARNWVKALNDCIV